MSAVFQWKVANLEKKSLTVFRRFGSSRLWSSDVSVLLSLCPVAMAAAEAQEAKAKCGSCGLEYSQQEGRLHGRNFKCGNCKNVEQTLRRHLGTTADLQEFSQEESEKFFKATHAAKCLDGKLAWQTIRATLLKRMTEMRIKSFESKVAVEELPLSVLLTRGWDLEGRGRL